VTLITAVHPHTIGKHKLNPLSTVIILLSPLVLVQWC